MDADGSTTGTNARRPPSLAVDVASPSADAGTVKGMRNLPGSSDDWEASELRLMPRDCWVRKGRRFDPCFWPGFLRAPPGDALVKS